MSSDASKIYRPTSDASGEVRIETVRALSRQRVTRSDALRGVIAAARAYTAAREACPLGDWQARIENAGWELAQAVRAFDKTDI